MNQILEWLSVGDLRSNGLANEVAAAVLQNPELFVDMYAGLFESQDVIRAHASDALEKVARTRPDLFIERLPEMVSITRHESLPVVKMHLAMTFGHLALYEAQLDILRSVLVDLLEDESVFTKSWAIASLCIIGRMYPQESQSLVNRISQLQRDSSIAIRSRTGKALKILTNPSSPFPPGWIKSEQIKERLAS